MKKYLKTLIITSSFITASQSATFGGSLEVINNTPNTVQIFIRGENSSKYRREFIESHQTKKMNIVEENVENKPVFQVIASTSSGGDPDWRLLGGECNHLLTRKNYTVLIESSVGGFKTSCTTLE